MDQSLHVVCPACAAVNRVPAPRLLAGPTCGRCKAALFQARPVELTSANFDAQLGRSDLPLLVDFWAPWCGPCRMMAPAFERAAAELEPRVRLAKLNTEAESRIAARYDVRSIPTLVAFRGGRELARQPGAMDLQGILSWARSVFGG